MPAVVHALPAWARGAEDTDPPPPRRPSCHISSTLTSFAVGGGQSPPTWLSPNLWPSPPPLGYYQMPFLLRGCGERQPPTARGSTHTHRGANEEGKRGQDSGPKDISPFRFPTHPARPPARDASGPGTVRSMSPGWGQWQGGGMGRLGGSGCPHQGKTGECSRRVGRPQAGTRPGEPAGDPAESSGTSPPPTGAS